VRGRLVRLLVTTPRPRRSPRRPCPFKTQRGDGRHVKRFVKAMVPRVFHPGQKLTVMIAQPDLLPERAQITIRRNKKPATRAL
jgi:hypothetical protein